MIVDNEADSRHSGQEGRRARLVQSSRREHVAERSLALLCANVVEPRPVQSVCRTGSNACLGFPVVVRYPRHNRRKVGALGEDGGAFDDRAAGGMRTGEALYQREDRLVIHSFTPYSPRDIGLDQVLGTRRVVFSPHAPSS